MSDENQQFANTLRQITGAPFIRNNNIIVGDDFVEKKSKQKFSVDAIIYQLSQSGLTVKEGGHSWEFSKCVRP